MFTLQAKSEENEEHKSYEIFFHSLNNRQIYEGEKKHLIQLYVTTMHIELRSKIF